MSRSRTVGQPFWRYVRGYLTVYLPRIRCLSANTVDAYRQSIGAYCQFLKDKRHLEFSKVSFEQLTRESVMAFLQWLQGRSAAVATCNLRLSSLKAFLKYCAEEDLSLYSVYQGVSGIPLMKAPKAPVAYLSETALKEVLSQPDIRTPKGRRNRMILILLYDTGTRVQELVDLRLADLHLEAPTPFVIVTGKGGKTRSIPLMDKTVAHLTEYLRRFHTDPVGDSSAPLFYSMRAGRPHRLSTDAIAVMLNAYGRSARRVCLEVPERVHPHLMRHTRAMHLYRAGMPLSYIAELLGHASMTTTEVYAAADVEMLRAALEKADPQLAEQMPSWKDEESLRKLCGL
jgi:integrase/recombinase XerD